MKSPDAASQEPMDDFDLEILDGIRELFELADPMPPDLPERIRFSLAMRGLEAEVARLAATDDDDSRLVAARGAQEHSRTITFDSESLTIMIRIDSNADGTVRIDGWLAPPQRREIEMQTVTEPYRVRSDDHGRFAFISVPRGTARLIVTAAEPADGRSGPPVVTPPLIL
jgi:hypothetical protein